MGERTNQEGDRDRGAGDADQREGAGVRGAGTPLEHPGGQILAEAAASAFGKGRHRAVERGIAQLEAASRRVKRRSRKEESRRHGPEGEPCGNALEYQTERDAKPVAARRVSAAPAVRAVRTRP